MVLDGVAEAWSRPPRGDPRARARAWCRRSSATARLEPSLEPIRDEELREALVSLWSTLRPRQRRLRAARPKFPQASVIELLLARGEREMSLGTLAAMARGGIYDQVGGGFARYSVDATWTVPHFEKMLYDNALLARAYLHGWQVSGERALPRGSAARRSTGRCARCGARGRLLLGARRRLRGRRGQVLRVDGRRAARRARPRSSPTDAIEYFGATERGNSSTG